MNSKALFCTLFGVFFSSFSFAISDGACQAQRKMFPAVWKDTSKETTEFTCAGHYLHDVKIRTSRYAGKTQASVTINDGTVKVYRVHDAGSSLAALRAGLVTLPLWTEKSCYIRGNLSDAAVFTIAQDEATPGNFTAFIEHDGMVDFLPACVRGNNSPK